MRMAIKDRLNWWGQYLDETPERPAVSKPHIWFEDGCYQVSVSLLRWQAPIAIRRRWPKAHKWVRQQNEAREFGMVVPGTK